MNRHRIPDGPAEPDELTAARRPLPEPAHGSASPAEDRTRRLDSSITNGRAAAPRAATSPTDDPARGRHGAQRAVRELWETERLPGPRRETWPPYVPEQDEEEVTQQPQVLSFPAQQPEAQWRPQRTQPQTEDRAPRIRVKIDTKPVYALIDTGASGNFIKSNQVRYKEINRDSSRMETVQLACQSATSQTLGTVRVDMIIQEQTYVIECRIIQDLREELILGRKWLCQEQAVIDLAQGCLHVGKQERQTLYWDQAVTRNTPLDPPEIKMGDIPEEEKDRYQKILNQHAGAFSRVPVAGCTPTTTHKIRLKDDTPVKCRTYRCSEHRKKLINEEISKMLQQGIIRRSTSDYASPIVVVEKKDGEKRFCIDYRNLNAKTIAETSYLPPIQDTLLELGEATIFSSLDLKSGYWQVPVEEESRKYTAFSSPDGGSYEFCVMPFGLSGAPGTFQKLMIKVLGTYVHRFVKVYLDDLIVYSRTHEEHRRHLALVLERLSEHHLVCSPDKCRIAVDHLEYLGHIITKDHNSPQPQHLKRIKETRPPRNIKELRRFLGLANWLRDYVPRFAELAAPLTNLLAKNQKFQWTPGAQGAFEALKAALEGPLQLSRPHPHRMFALQTDASNVGIAAVLFQTDENQRRYIIAYASSKYSPTEAKYHINEQEVLAAVWGIKKFRAYLQDHPFTLYTDNRSLLWLNKYADEKAKLTRWALALQAYQLKVIHVPAARNELPDFLSRHPEGETPATRPLDNPLAHPSLLQINVETLFERVRRAQLQDPETRIQRLRLEAERRGDPENQPGDATAARLEVRQGYVYRIRGQKQQLLVPETLIRRVLEEIHDGPLAGHPGAEETRRQIKQRYWWPGMDNDVREWVRTCAICAAVKVGPPQPHAPLRPRTPEEPWQTISLDVLGPFEDVPARHRFIITLTDTFSRWVEARTSPRATAQDQIGFVEETCHRFGFPNTIITDNARAYRGRRWARFCRQNQIARYSTAIYHQRENPIERRVQELKKTLRALVYNDPRNWPSQLNNALFALRNRENAATGMTPSRILFGKELQKPGEGREPIQLREVPEARQDRLDRARRRQEIYIRQLFPEPRQAPVTFYRGQQVLTRARAGRPPFGPKWTGPYEIKQRLGDNTYLIDQNGNQQVIHADDIRPAPRPRPPRLQDNQGHPAPSVSIEEGKRPAEQETGTETPRIFRRGKQTWMMVYDPPARVQPAPGVEHEDSILTQGVGSSPTSPNLDLAPPDRPSDEPAEKPETVNLIDQLPSQADCTECLTPAQNTAEVSASAPAAAASNTAAEGEDPIHFLCRFILATAEDRTAAAATENAVPAKEQASLSPLTIEKVTQPDVPTRDSKPPVPQLLTPKPECGSGPKLDTTPPEDPQPLQREQNPRRPSPRRSQRLQEQRARSAHQPPDATAIASRRSTRTSATYAIHGRRSRGRRRPRRGLSKQILHCRRLDPATGPPTQGPPSPWVDAD